MVNKAGLRLEVGGGKRYFSYKTEYDLTMHTAAAGCVSSHTLSNLS
jgi:hypothetical protein